MGYISCFQVYSDQADDRHEESGKVLLKRQENSVLEGLVSTII